VRDPRDLEVDLGLPVLAAIPAVSVYQTNSSKGLARLAGWRAKEVMA
jgi:hypothetical protein